MKSLSIARATPITLVTSPRCEPLIPLLEGQPYIAAARADWNWEISGDCPGLQPWLPPRDVRTEAELTHSAEVIHLGLREWPEPNLFQVYARYAGVDPSSRWISPLHADQDAPYVTPTVAAAFTDEWVELKVGLLEALAKALFNVRFMILTQGHGFCRLASEFSLPFKNVFWQDAAISAVPRWIRRCHLLLTDKSSIRVMAVGMGFPTVVVEPSPPRHNPIFDPPAEAQAKEYVLNGFDAREVVDLVRRALAHPLR